MIFLYVLLYFLIGLLIMLVFLRIRMVVPDEPGPTVFLGILIWPVIIIISLLEYLYNKNH